MSTLTIYPDPGTGATTVDGIMLDFTAGSWATVRGAAGDLALASQNASNVASIDTNGSEWEFIQRGIFTFDTSALTSGATISATVFSLKGQAKTDDFTDSVAVVGATPANDNNLVAGDYAQLSTTAYAAPIAISALSTAAYNDWTFNATGRAAVSKTGITKIGTRTESDRSDTEPGFVANKISTFASWMADVSGTAQDPKLVITYTLGGGTTYQITLSATGVGTAATSKTVGRLLAAVGVGTGALSKVVKRTYAAIGVGVPAISKTIRKVLAVTGVGTVAFSRTRIKTIILSAVCVGTASMNKKISRTFTAVGVGVGVMHKKIAKTFAAIGAGVAAYSRLAASALVPGVDVLEVNIATHTLEVNIPLHRLDVMIAKHTLEVDL